MKKDYLTFTDLSPKQTLTLLDRAIALKKKGSLNVLRGKTLALVFEKESTRTRVSFQVAMNRLGGNAIYLSPNTSQLSRGESYADTARVLSRYVDGLVLRTFGQDVIREVASHASIPVINGLTDLYHPCQILADLMTVLERKKRLSKLKICYVGDGNNMANTWIEAAMHLGFNLNVACPKGFEPEAAIIAKAKAHKNITLTDDPIEAVTGTHVVNTDTWFSMGQEVSTKKRKAFAPFQVNGALLKKADPSAMVLHCLPAHRGEEITDDVLDGPQSAVFDEAENRLYVQMALLELLLGKKKR